MYFTYFYLFFLFTILYYRRQYFNDFLIFN